MIKTYLKDTDWCDMVLWFLVRICLGVGLSPVARRAITSTNIEVMSMIIKGYKSQWNTKQTTFFFHETTMENVRKYWYFCSSFNIIFCVPKHHCCLILMTES